jgi:DNA-binding MarR family transcriptional regulator
MRVSEPRGKTRQRRLRVGARIGTAESTAKHEVRLRVPPPGPKQRIENELRAGQGFLESELHEAHLLQVGGIFELAGALALPLAGAGDRSEHVAEQQRIQEQIGTLRLTPPQHNVLSAVRAHPGSHQIEIARQVGYDRATVGALLVNLEARALLSRRSSSADRRIKTLHITARGRRLLDASTPAMVRINQQILGPLAAHERELFMALLAKIAFSRADAELPQAFALLRLDAGRYAMAMPRRRHHRTLIPIVRTRRTELDHDHVRMDRPAV